MDTSHLRAAALAGALLVLTCQSAAISQTTTARASAPASHPAGPLHTFEIGASDFLLDGQPFVIRSGEMHAARVPREYWRQRLEMVRAVGCNVVCTYLFWNQHEPRAGEFNFEGQADVADFCRVAQDVGLFVILRPGPYVCAEWDFGGLPAWLLKTPDMKVRSNAPQFLEPAQRYLRRVGAELAPLQVTRGGPILMVQLENEFGSFGNDKAYLGALRDTLRNAGFEVPLYTCDGPSQLPSGSHPDVLSAVNFGSDPEQNFATLRKLRDSGPLMCGEYYPGWYDSWGKPHHTGNTEKTVNELEWMLQNRASFNIYMIHGGTSFGFSAGANSPPFAPQTTSYDYDAPIDEAGRATPKFRALRELFARHLNPGETLPEIPAPNPVIEIPEIQITEAAPLFSNVAVGKRELLPRTQETLDQNAGLILYRRVIGGGPKAAIRFGGVHDFAVAFLDANPVATLDRRYRDAKFELPARKQPARLDILVDPFGRVNYGPDILDRKGLIGRAEFLIDNQKVEMNDWTVHCFPFDEEMFSRLSYRPIAEIDAPERGMVNLPEQAAAIMTSQATGPAFFRAQFTLDKVGDTFLDMRSWSKGIVLINGHNLGRYWHIGPQQTLYVPGCWLKRGRNELIVFELLTPDVRKRSVTGLTEPILNELHDDPRAPLPRRAPGQTLNLKGLVPAHTAAFAPGEETRVVRFAASKGRFCCIEALTPLKEGDAFASLAELRWLDGDGRELPSEAWEVIYADSEELRGEDGRGLNAIDGDPATYWHTQWQGGAPAYPHHLVIDLHSAQMVGGIRYTPRRDSANGRIGQYRIFVSETPFPGL